MRSLLSRQRVREREMREYEVKVTKNHRIDMGKLKWRKQNRKLFPRHSMAMENIIQNQIMFNSMYSFICAIFRLRNRFRSLQCYI